MRPPEGDQQPAQVAPRIPKPRQEMPAKVRKPPTQASCAASGDCFGLHPQGNEASQAADGGEATHIPAMAREQKRKAAIAACKAAGHDKMADTLQKEHDATAIKPEKAGRKFYGQAVHFAQQCAAKVAAAKAALKKAQEAVGAAQGCLRERRKDCDEADADKAKYFAKLTKEERGSAQAENYAGDSTAAILEKLRKLFEAVKAPSAESKPKPDEEAEDPAATPAGANDGDGETNMGAGSAERAKVETGGSSSVPRILEELLTMGRAMAGETMPAKRDTDAGDESPAQRLGTE